ncbi:GntR family transcriptional regulator [Anaeroselena agilis]|uniref:GntR family transcriptional regulator n=1 Tax=Anaeroselena agilis TaxID=3063788 RepID=A0ABU3P352_9FIRM|nr:GntR family transcriptional regulator [Selenomonadales bacterium 4137-cl]
MKIFDLLANGKQPVITTKLEAVYNVLRENIVSGKLEPGTRLIIKKIAQDLGVSEIPVREAIRMLEAQNLVTMTPHAGAQVATFDLDDIREVTDIRSLLEGYAARTAIPFIGDEAIADLEMCIEEMERCIHTEDNVNFGILNRKFHQKIYEHSPLKRLYRMIYEMWDGSERTRAVFSLSKRRPQESVQEHKAILKAIKEHDGDTVEKLIRDHRQRVGSILIDHLKKK